MFWIWIGALAVSFIAIPHNNQNAAVFFLLLVGGLVLMAI